MDDFLYRDLPRVAKRAHRLGLACNYGIEKDPSALRHALEQVNYVFWSIRDEKVAAQLREVLKKDRERYIIAGIPTIAFFASSIRKSVDKALRRLNTDYLDIFQIGWVGRASALNESTTAELCRLREEGKVKAIGISIHDRERAGRLAKDSPLDLLMVRYNAAHPGAEKDVFPHLPSPEQQGGRKSVVAYTATSWGQLLSPPAGWDGAIPKAGVCYRFCLSNPAVDIVLTGPKDRTQFDENLAEVQKGPLSASEMSEIRRLGDYVHRKGKNPFAPA